MNTDKWVIFDLDGTLADIDDRRKNQKKIMAKWIGINSLIQLIYG